VRKLADGTTTGHALDAVWGGTDQQTYGIVGADQRLTRFVPARSGPLIAINRRSKRFATSGQLRWINAGAGMSAEPLIAGQPALAW
jgi:hypothetical protein